MPILLSPDPAATPTNSGRRLDDYAPATAAADINSGPQEPRSHASPVLLWETLRVTGLGWASR